jgi:membrane associated rhomboid family serine protease
MSLPPPPASSGGHRQGGTQLACYRHPNREAGRRCTRCGKPACADCLVQAAVGSHCLECAKAAQPDIKRRARTWNASQPALVTMTLIGVNVVLFGLAALRDPQSITGRLTQAHVDLDLYRPFLEQDGEWYRLVTSGFMHFGIIHLGFNMYLLYLLGQMLEPALGRVRFGLVYMAGLFGGSAGALLLDGNALVAGASGAVFGLMALAFVGYYLQGMNPLNTSIGTLLLLNLFLTFFLRDRISIGGHIGGAVAGGLCALVVMAPRHRRFPDWATYATPVAVSLGAIVLSVVTVS